MADSGIDCLKIDFLKLSSLTSLARPAGIEPATLGLEGRCSIQLSYGRTQEHSGY